MTSLSTSVNDICTCIQIIQQAQWSSIGGEYVYERAGAHIRQKTTDISHHYSQCSRLTDREIFWLKILQGLCTDRVQW